MKTTSSRMMNGIGIVMLSSLVAVCGAKNDNPDLLGLALLGGISARNADTKGLAALDLGMAASFAVFGGGAGITNQGTGTVITGAMGTTGASTMLTGFHNAA